MMKPGPSEFARSRKALTLPSLFVTKGIEGSSAGKMTVRAETLQKLVETFDESERSLKSPAKTRR